ncbi:MAG: Smr/MutS family protein [Clostridia bacterium]|nr:Smr/MutS family protein [Clostridia bacterium]
MRQSMPQDYVTVNLEEGRPTVDIALRRLSSELVRLRAQRVKAVKLIHGYGSSGVGGALRVGVRQHLEHLKKKGAIKLYVPGEKFEIFSIDTIKMLDQCESLRSDRDLGRYNNGVTLVLL